MLWEKHRKRNPPREGVCPERIDKKGGVGRINRSNRNDIHSAYITELGDISLGGLYLYSQKGDV